MTYLPPLIDDGDEPKTLRSHQARQMRHAALEHSHIAPLSAFVRCLREKTGLEERIPYFDPFDGGMGADCLFLLEAPGPKAVETGFISRDNPDETAKNFFDLNKEAKIDRRRTIVWNIVPWFIGSESETQPANGADLKRIRPANSKDLRTATPYLTRLLELLPKLHSVVLLGKKAARAGATIRTLHPNTRIYLIPHTSPMFINRSKEKNRSLILEKLKLVADNLPR